MDGERKTLIYVDDVNFSLMTVKDSLKDYYKIYPAQSVDIMFNILHQLDDINNIKPDAILMDLNMPEVGGYEALTMLKADEHYAEIPVIFLTAKSDSESIEKGMRLGAAAHVGKPFLKKDLIDTIERVINMEFEVAMDAEVGHDDGKPCVLAIDDVPAMLMAVKQALGDYFKVYMLSKPTELEEYLQQIKPDLFILDCNMPLMHGFDLVPIIRENPEHRDTPIIFLTSEGTVDHLTTAINLGASSFIVKPFNARTLREKVSQLIKIED